MPQQSQPPAKPFESRHQGLRGWPISIMWGLVAAVVYLANGREIGQDDTHATTALPLAIVRGDGIVLDRFRPFLREFDGGLSNYVNRWGNHIVSLYPVAPAILATPVYWPHAIFWDRTQPNWDRDPVRTWNDCHVMGKHAAALIVALVVVILRQVMVALRIGFVAEFVAMAAAAFGSNLYAVASQAMWQHGPAALALTCAILWLSPSSPSQGRFVAAGVAAGWLVACRAIDLVFALAILAWVIRIHPRRLPWFLPGLALCGGLLLAYNLRIFGAIEGGQAILESRHPRIHGVAGPWSGNLLEGLAGTLFSPARGLFVYAPWTALALLLVPVYAARIKEATLVRWLLWALVPYGLILSKYAVWWGGFSFGPRYWTEVMPLFAIALGYAVDWSIKSRRYGVLAIIALTVVAAIGVQVIGAYLYPSSWNLNPANVDLNHARLWDWSDNELARCLRESFGQRGR